MQKIYSPAQQIAYIIFSSKKGRKYLFSACGNTDTIKRYCDMNKINYTKCKESVSDGIHYFDVER